jgi:corrinoid protein of di/trimethylamine methyltransferase
MTVPEPGILERIAQVIVEGDSEGTKRLCQEALNAGVDPLLAIDNGVSHGAKEAGARFEKNELFLSDLILAGAAMKAGLDVLMPEMLKRKDRPSSLGRFLIGTVEGDVHDIGKTVVSSMLTAEGFEVIDLGADVPDEIFIRKVEEHQPQILGLSALMTTTMTKQKDVIEGFVMSGLRDKVKIMVGGAAVTRQWSEKIGADGYGEHAVQAAKVARKLAGL